jgi:hypothetical protein
MRTIYLAIIIAFLSLCVLSPACKAQDSNNPATKAKIPAAYDVTITEGKILPTSIDNCIREIMGEIFFSKPTRVDIEDNIRKAIESAFGGKEKGMVLWVNMTIDTDKLLNAFRKNDPNIKTIDKNSINELLKTSNSQSIVLEPKEGKDWQGRFLKQDIILNLKEKQSSQIIFAGRVRLIDFAFTYGLYPFITSGARQQNDIFPNIRPIKATSALSSITFYAKTINMQALRTNHMRFIVQPRGIVTEAIDVNLVTGDSIIYPGSNNRGSPREMTISSSDVKEIGNMLTSNEFLSIPQQKTMTGADGTSYFIEVDIDGSYLWKCHWETDDPNYINIIEKLKTLFQLRNMPTIRGTLDTRNQIRP